MLYEVDNKKKWQVSKREKVEKKMWTADGNKGMMRSRSGRTWIAGMTCFWWTCG